MSKFIHSDLGHRSKGDVLQVVLKGGAANVRLLDSSNFGRYKQGKQHRFHGGRAKKSPVRIPIPRSGRWHAVVDMQGLRGSTKASFNVVPGSAMKPLPPIRERRPEIMAVAENAARVIDGEDTPTFDIFVSHASEDKDDVVRPLCAALQGHGLSVWYDEFELRVGDSLRRKIDQGIAGSRFGLVVLSGAFFAKGWTEYELDGLVTMSVGGEQTLLPIWHGVSKDEVVRRSPSLADKVALRTSDYTVTEIADEIASVVASQKAATSSAISENLE